jgi:hypothetical protein
MTTTIQAFKRKKTHQTDITSLGVSLLFSINAAGHAVCDVEDGAAIDWLMQWPQSFGVYQPEEAAKAESVPPPAAKSTQKPGRQSAKAEKPPADDKYILASGEDKFDLRPLDDDKLREFAAANKIALPDDAKGDAIRDVIVAALQVGA